MGQQFLIDSNVIIDYLDGKLSDSGMALISDVVDTAPHISIITKIEVLGYKLPEASYKVLTDFITLCTTFGLSDDIVETTVDLKKIYKIKTPDAIIAATAIVSGYTLITRNVKDFINIAQLNILNPWEVK